MQVGVLVQFHGQFYSLNLEGLAVKINKIISFVMEGNSNLAPIILQAYSG